MRGDVTPSTLVGRFTYRPDTDVWTWSDEMFRIHGYEPGEVVPSTDLVMHHMHPDDVAGAWDTRDDALATGRSIVFPHRIRPAHGPMRFVIAAGHLEEDADGQLLTGHVIDVTQSGEDVLQPHMDRVIQDFTDHRAVIEQAKGVLMQLFSIAAATAWDMLRAYSQHTNRSVRVTAESLVEAATHDQTPAKTATRVDVLRTIDDLLGGAT